MRRTGRHAFFLALCGVVAIAFWPTSSSAQPGTFGIGLIVGEPTGINGKYFMSRESAIQGAAAWSLSGSNAFHLQGDYLFHKYDVFRVSKGELPLYVGLGARIVFRDVGDNTFGVRVPVGVQYNFVGVPIDAFFEIVPTLDLTPDTDFDLEAAIGARFWFGGTGVESSSSRPRTKSKDSDRGP